MNADTLIQTLGKELFEVARPYWCSDAESLHAAIASFILQVLQSEKLEQARDEHVLPLDELEKRHILSTLELFGGNQVRTAAALGVDRGRLYRSLQRYGLKTVKLVVDERRCRRPGKVRKCQNKKY